MAVRHPEAAGKDQAAADGRGSGKDRSPMLEFRRGRLVTRAGARRASDGRSRKDAKVAAEENMV